MTDKIAPPPGKKTRYSGYRSYGYLEAGRDYRDFKMATEIERVPSASVDVTPEEERRVREIFDRTVITALHEHPFVVPADLSEMFEYRRQGRDVTGYEGV